MGNPIVKEERPAILRYFPIPGCLSPGQLNAAPKHRLLILGRSREAKLLKPLDLPLALWSVQCQLDQPDSELCERPREQ